MKLTPRVKKILACYESDNPGTKANLARILMQVWLSSLNGWVCGVDGPDRVDEDLAAAADRLSGSFDQAKPAEPWYPLSEREFEVARLVAAGLTNRQIAEQLVLAPKTISAHVTHILTKLGAARRAPRGDRRVVRDREAGHSAVKRCRW